MYLAGNDYVPEFLTGLEYLKFMAGLYGEQLSVDEVSALFARYGMTGRERNLIEDYSHGMRKKVQLVAALLLRRAVTIIDETLNGIDLDAQFAFEEDISLLTQRGGSLLLCSHDFGLLQRTCSRVLFLHHGTLAVDDTLTAVDTEYGSLEQMVRDVLTAR